MQERRGSSALAAVLFIAGVGGGFLVLVHQALGSTVGPDFGEVILARETPSGTKAFPIWFLRGHDGVWRIEGM